MSGNATLKNFKAMMAEAKLPEATVEICLRGDLVADFEELDRQLTEAEETREKSNSLDGGSVSAEIAEKMEVLRIDMREYTYPFRVRALPKREFRALVNEHPPRSTKNDGGETEINQVDALFNVNVDSFFDAMVKRSIVDPELTPSEYSDLVDEKLTDNQFESLALRCWRLNKNDVDIPFSSAASKISRNSGTESN